jgi:1-acyl-sn-glycerol-3-phosphate acyltransferase
VIKRKGERYQLQWKSDTDFVRLAAKCNAIIVPFGAVGADDAFDLYMDTDEILADSRIGPLAERILASVDPTRDPGESIFPITKIPGTDFPSPLPFPNFNRVYFKIGKPIDAKSINPKDEEACAVVYREVRKSVESQISDLLVVREQDPDSSALGRLVNSAQRMWPKMPM